MSNKVCMNSFLETYNHMNFSKIHLIVVFLNDSLTFMKAFP